MADWTVRSCGGFSSAPFVRLFLTAISRDRRVSAVMITDVVRTSLAAMASPGGWDDAVRPTQRRRRRTRGYRLNGSEATGGFPVFAVFPPEQLLTVVFLALVVLSIAISADTSTLVVTVLATKRTVVLTTSAVVRWDRFQGVLAVTALLVGGGETLQTVAVLTGGVFAAVSVVAILALRGYAVRAFSTRLWAFALLPL